MAKYLPPVKCPSPNFNERTLKIDTIVLHYTAGELVSSLDHLVDPQGTSRVSAHYVVARDGTIYHLVDESKRAWHAGVSRWAGRADVNSSSIGIEIVNMGRNKDGSFDPYPDAQIDAVIELCQDIKRRHPIVHVVGHSDVAIGRKIDPGLHFPWKKLAENGVGFWTDDLLPPRLTKKEMLEALGYDTTNEKTAFVAFQRHYYPQGPQKLGSSALYRLSAVYRAKKAAEGELQRLAAKSLSLFAPASA